MLSTLLLALRLCTRTLAIVKWGWDDVLLLAAWVSVVGICIVCYREDFPSLFKTTKLLKLSFSIVLVIEGGAGHHLEAVFENNPQTITTRCKLIYALS